VKRGLYFLACLAIASAAVAAVRVTAAPAGDYLSVAAIPLTKGVNSGTLSPGEERWYTFTRAALEDAALGGRAFTLVHTPGGDEAAAQVNFRIFTGDQQAVWQPGGEAANMGEGGLVERDSDQSTVEHLWFGNLANGAVYYVKVFNRSPNPVAYHLYPGDAASSEFLQPAVTVPAMAQALVDPANAGAAQPPSAADMSTGADPGSPLALREGINSGTLAPGQARWYTFKRASLEGGMQFAALTLKHVPGEGNVANYVNFEIFTGDQRALWARGDEDEMTNMGAGGYVSRDRDPNTGERLWVGNLINGATYYVKVLNSSKVPIDYRLYTQDVIDSEFGEKGNEAPPWPSLSSPLPSTPARQAAGEPTPGVTGGADPGSALTLQGGINSGSLQPGQEQWYLFKRSNRDGVVLQYAALTLKHVPGEGNVANYVNFEIFSGDQRALWARGDKDKMTNMGAGQFVSRDRDPNTGERLWSGNLINGADYYVRVFNHSQEPIEYRLYPQDIIDSEFERTN
jgi:hypothetical protein